MSTSTAGSFQVRQKSKQVVDYHRDESTPGKPLHLLIPGGLVALLILGLELFVAYRAFYDKTLDKGPGIALMLGLIPFYVGAVFSFSYAYELYDLNKAIRLTAIIVLVTVFFVVIICVLLAVLGEAKGGGGSSSSRSSSSSSSSGGAGGWFSIDSNSTTSASTNAGVQAIACASCGRLFVPAGDIPGCPYCQFAGPAPLPGQIIQ